MKNLPDKIYLQVCGDCNANDCENCKFEDLEDNVTWSKDKIFDKDIEYTRTDVFIEKACEYWYQYNRDIVKRHGAKAVLGCGEFTVHVEDFRKYLEESKI